MLTASWAGLQGLARTQAACFAGLSAAHHAQIKKYQREIISLGFKTGLLVEGMTLQPMGNTAEGVEETIEADFNRVSVAQALVYHFGDLTLTPTPAHSLSSPHKARL